jgi:hypothetical protein
MKCIILFFSVILSITVCSQSSVPNERGKLFYDKFMKIVEDIKKKDAENLPNEVMALRILADNAMKQLEYLKKRDPEYNTSSLEAMVKPYIEAKTAEVEAHNKKIDDASWHTGEQGCYGLFMANTTTEMRGTGNLEEDIKAHKVQLIAYQEKLNNILASHMAGVEHCKSFITSRIDLGRQTAEKFRKRFDNLIYSNDVKYLYREIVGEEAFWNAANKLYPDLAGTAEVHSLFKSLLATDGGLEGILAKAAAKKAEKLKNTFMPKPVQVNAALEAEFKEAFTAEGWNETIIKINILSREWNIVRNELTGAIICRAQSAAIVAKQKSGNCIMYDFTIKQQYTGSGYSGVSSRYTHDILAAEFLCENAGK